MPPMTSNQPNPDPNASIWNSLAGLFSNDANASRAPTAEENQAQLQAMNALSNPPQQTLNPNPGNEVEDPFMQAGRSGAPGASADWSHFNQLMGKVNNQGVQSINDQKSQLQKIQDQVNQMPTQQQKPDLSGLMALADAWGNNGSHLAQGYQAPMSAEKLQELQLAAQEKVSGLQNNLSKDDLSLLKDQLQSELQKNLVDTRWGPNTAKSAQGDDKVVGTLQQSMLKDKNFVAAQSMQDEGATIKQLLVQASSGDPRQSAFAAAQLPIRIARFNTGGQRINVPEIQRATGNQDWADRWNQAISTAKTGQLTPENAQSMAAYLDTVLGGAQETVNKTQMDYANKIRARTTYDGPTAYEKLTGQAYKPPTAMRQAPEMTPMDPSTMTREQKIQFLQGNP